MTPKQFFNWSAVALLLTAVAKLYCIPGTAKILPLKDQLLGLGYRRLLLLTALLEIGIAVYLLMSRSDSSRSLVLLWLSANFVSYHIGIRLLGFTGCPCLGRLAGRLPVAPGFAESMLGVLILYWFIGSLYLVSHQFRSAAGRPDDHGSDLPAAP